jgi:hypothetical protein
MPAHDWTRVISGIFHEFHQTWIPIIKNALNDGLLPAGYYALAEQVTEGPRPDVVALEAEDRAEHWLQTASGNPALAVAEHPPQVKYTEEQERDIYARSADRIAVRHASGDRVVAYIEIVSPGNKHSELEFSKFLEKLNEALDRGCHLLIIDVLPPGRNDPRGVHAAFWEQRSEQAHGVTEEELLGVSSYSAVRVGESGFVPRAYFQPFAVGAALPVMPLFLTSQHYINLPLEPTYQEAWRGVPTRWKRIIEAQDDGGGRVA